MPPLKGYLPKLLFAVIVAGKSARFALNAVVKLLGSGVLGEGDGQEFYDTLKRWHSSGNLVHGLRSAATGKYTLVEGFLDDVFKFHADDESLRLAEIDDLESLPGVGPKTSRFFKLWVDPEAEVAALDVHVMRWLRSNGFPEAPKKTPPQGRQYRKWERIFVNVAKSRDMTPRQLDNVVWYSGTKWPV